MMEKWRRHLNRSDKAGFLLTDLSKAFVFLWHDLLIAISSKDYESLKVIWSYLSDRFQRERINNSFVKWVKLIF